MVECSFPDRVVIYFVVSMIEVLFPICTLLWLVNSYVFRQGRIKIGETKVLFFKDINPNFCKSVDC